MNYNLSLDTSEVNRCLLCADAPCTKACPQQSDVANILRSLYFWNYMGAVRKLDGTDCTYCNAPCESSCILKKAGQPVAIREILLSLRDDKSVIPAEKLNDVDLSTDICGVKLENPFLLSSSVVASTYDMCRRAFMAGWAGAC